MKHFSIILWAVDILLITGIMIYGAIMATLRNDVFACIWSFMIALVVTVIFFMVWAICSDYKKYNK